MIKAFLGALAAVLAAVLVVMIAGAAYAQRRYGRQAVAELS